MMTYFDDADLEVAAKTLWGEARSEPSIGQIAVAAVLCNRAARAGFAGTLAGQPGALKRICRAPWQFSCWNSDDPNHAQILALRAGDYASQRKVMADVLAGRIPDPTQGADHYHTVARPPGVSSWPPVWAASMRKAGQFGHHLFYDGTLPPGGARVLIQGCQGDDVRALQIELVKRQCLAGAADGVFGPLTRAGVVAFQRLHRLVDDGVVGPQTRAALGL